MLDPDRREVDPDECRADLAREPQARAAPAAREIEEGLASTRLERRGDLTESVERDERERINFGRKFARR